MKSSFVEQILLTTNITENQATSHSVLRDQRFNLVILLYLQPTGWAKCSIYSKHGNIHLLYLLYLSIKAANHA